VDGDGRAELIVGAWQYGKVAVGAGKAYLYSGRDGHLLATFTCRIPGEAFGFDAVGIGGVDPDGTARPADHFGGACHSAPGTRFRKK